MRDPMWDQLTDDQVAGDIATYQDQIGYFMAQHQGTSRALHEARLALGTISTIRYEGQPVPLGIRQTKVARLLQEAVDTLCVEQVSRWEDVRGAEDRLAEAIEEQERRKGVTP